MKKIRTVSKDRSYFLLLKDLYDAYLKACLRKGTTSNRLAFELRKEEELSSLARSILERDYSPYPSVRFVVTEPVVREVIAASFRERVVHHYIDSYIAPFLERILIYDCYSCREGKGTSFGVDRLEHHIRSCSRNYTSPCHILKLDISGYFMNIDREILCSKFVKMMEKAGRWTDPETGCPYNASERFSHVLYLGKHIIMNDPLENCIYKGDPALLALLPHSKSLEYSPEGCGLPIGNLTSQLFSNLYLNDFDHYMKSVLKLRHYGRYVDDFYVVHPDPDYLRSLIPDIRRFLTEDVSLCIHPKKIVLHDVMRGVEFLGVYLKPFRRYPLHRTVRRISDRIRRMNRSDEAALRKDRKKLGHVLSSANSLLGILNAGRTYRLKRRLFRHFILFRFGYMNSFMKKFVLCKPMD